MQPLRIEDPQWAGAFRLLARLGSGGMGEVFLARSPQGEMAAVKLISAQYADNTEYRRRFRREVAATRTVTSRWTAPVLDADVDSSRPWVAMGFIEGVTLGEAVTKVGGALPDNAVLQLANGLAGALNSIHRTGLVHRDLKPSNVMLTSDGPMVIDFGIVRTADASVLTRIGGLMGTVDYMSPEQARGREAGPASDVFSLGCVLAFAATGRPPFGRAADLGVPAVLMRIVSHEYDLGRVSPDVLPLITACLAQPASDRPSPAQIMEAAAVRSAVASARNGDWLPQVLADAVAQQAEAVAALDSTRRRNVVPPTPTVVRTGNAAAETELAATRRLGPRHAWQLPPATPPEPQKNRLAKVTASLLAAILAGLVAATVGVVLPMFHGPDDKPGDKNEATPTPELGEVPDSLLGEWESPVPSRPNGRVFYISIAQGWASQFDESAPEEVVVSTGGQWGPTCGHGYLTSAGESGIRFDFVRFKEANKICGSAGEQTITLVDPNHIEYRTEGWTVRLARVRGT
ncbi:serine/threonine-protein kinase [Streptomyces sp. cmx-18-6]|uniref:serine/threonine-protein kinase n=1 Tax=Streptomyces sp. cmx-18-6 TaxID=2790930 RepID=UPI00397FA2F4